MKEFAQLDSRYKVSTGCVCTCVCMLMIVCGVCVCAGGSADSRHLGVHRGYFADEDDSGRGHQGGPQAAAGRWHQEGAGAAGGLRPP